MLSDSIDYLKDSDDAVTTVLLGGVLSLLGFLLIPTLLLFGYFVRVLELTGEGEPEPPRFERWGALLVDGVKAFVIGFVYLLVPAVVALVFVGGGAAIADNAGVLGAIGIVGGGLLTLVVGLLVWYAVPAALANFARERRFSAAFDFGALRPVLGTETYATGWLLGLVVTIVGGAIIGVLAIVPLLGWLLAVLVAFYTQVMAFYIYGRAFGEAREHEPGTDTTVEGGQPAV